jgi:hypothetical protein
MRAAGAIFLATLLATVLGFWVVVGVTLIGLAALSVAAPLASGRR